MRLRLALAAVLAALLAGPAAAAHAQSPLGIQVLSSRPDLVAGGSPLVEVVVPADAYPAQVSVDAGGRDVTSSFGLRPDGRFYGRVEGLAVGQTVLTARLPDGRSAAVTANNHPIGGPVFAGTQVQPWVCTTSSNGMSAPTDAQCDAPTVYTFYYKSAVTGQFTSFDPASPPPAALVATTTTDQGKTVPYEIRDERGTIDRGIYDIAVIYDPAKPFEPWAPQAGWNHKLGFKFGGGCAPGHSQQGAQDPKDDMFLSRGYMVAVSSIDVNGNSCNPTTSAESLMMIKERIVERYGFIRFTMGDGCSGGAEQQHSITDQYPGLLDGIRPECTFPDLWTIGMFEKWDCQLLQNYFDNISPTLWTSPAARAAVLGGQQSPSMCVEITKALNGADQDWNPSGSGCGVTPVWPAPGAPRCTLQDYNVNAIGARPDGKANFPVDRVGVEYGLQALYAGAITPAQFVDLQKNVGGLDIDFQHIATRTQGDVAGIARMYQTDELSYGRNWAKVPEIEARTDDTYDEHSNVMHDIVRARMDLAYGNHANQVFWQEPVVGPFGLPTPDMHTLTFQVMDQWLTNIEADTSSDPLEVKVVRDKPASAVDGCYSNGQPVAQSLCDASHSTNILPIQVAGAPRAANILKCALKPLSQADFTSRGITFTSAQWSDLQAAFPTGVCDWTAAGVGQQPPAGDWLSFNQGGFTSLGSAPAVIPFTPHSTASAPLPFSAAPARSFPAVPAAIALAGALVAAVALSGRRRVVSVSARRSRRPRRR